MQYTLFYFEGVPKTCKLGCSLPQKYLQNPPLLYIRSLIVAVTLTLLFYVTVSLFHADEIIKCPLLTLFLFPFCLHRD